MRATRWGSSRAGKQDRSRPCVLMVVQNASVPLDRRVWLECLAFRDAGYGVAVICPAGPAEPPFRVLEDVRIRTYGPQPPSGRQFVSLDDGAALADYVYHPGRPHPESVPVTAVAAKEAHSV